MNNKQIITQQDKEFGARFKEMRIKDFVDQKSIGEYLGMFQSHISQIESGKRRLMPEFRLKLAKEKKWSMKYLDFGKGPNRLDKDYFKGNLITDIGELNVKMYLMENEIDKLRSDNNILLQAFQDLKDSLNK